MYLFFFFFCLSIFYFLFSLFYSTSCLDQKLLRLFSSKVFCLSLTACFLKHFGSLST